MKVFLLLSNATAWLKSQEALRHADTGAPLIATFNDLKKPLKIVIKRSKYYNTEVSKRYSPGDWKREGGCDSYIEVKR